MSAYWQIVVFIIHISKIGVNDLIMSLHHYDVVSIKLNTEEVFDEHILL